MMVSLLDASVPVSGQAVVTMLLPHAPVLALMQTLEFTYGLCHGCFHSVGNTLLIRSNSN